MLTRFVLRALFLSSDQAGHEDAMTAAAQQITFQDLSRPLVSALSYNERERLASAWRGTLREVEDCLTFIKSYQRILEKNLYPNDVERARKMLPWRLSAYLACVRRVSEYEERMTASGIPFAKSSSAWGA
jgi:hypothetical protein